MTARAPPALTQALGMPSPKLVPLLLADAERKALEALARKRTASQALALRARMVLACSEDGGVAPLTAVAGRTGGHPSKQEQTLVRKGLDHRVEHCR